MTLVFIDQDKLSVSKTNMRYGKKAPDVSDILPTVRERGVIQTLLVRPNPVPSDVEDHYEIVAGARRFHAARIVAAETGEAEPLPCRIFSETDDAAAIEASMIENLARLDADEVTQWETFTRLVKEGRDIADIAATFGLPDLTISRVLALGNLLPRVRSLYAAEKIDRATVRHLTLASKSQVRLRANALAALQRRELLRVAGELSGELGKPFLEMQIGKAVEGRLVRKIDLVSGRFALVERSREFTLVPWRSVLERHIGKQASVIMRAEGVSWRLSRGRPGPEIS
jgi:ParB/RepB/Spo0J family partition protein